MKPRHADLLAADIDRETLIKYLDRFMMFYIRTADKLTRTAPWLENLEGGIDYLKAVIIDDKLGLNAHLEEEMARLREAVVCEWTETVNTRLRRLASNTSSTATSVTRTCRWCQSANSTVRQRRMNVSR